MGHWECDQTYGFLNPTCSSSFEPPSSSTSSWQSNSSAVLSSYTNSSLGGSLLNRKIHSELIDPRLANNYLDKEAECMFHAAILCISLDPEQRLRVSKILKILEGDLPSYAVNMVMDNGELFIQGKS